MKAILVMNQDYFRKLGISATICAELGEPVGNGEVLLDAVTGERYEVSERGFPPARSAATMDRRHWLREASLSFRGKCDGITGRLLVDESLSTGSWAKLTGTIVSKSGKLPVGIPIVGAILSDDSQTIGLMKLTESGVEVYASAAKQLENASLDFVCRDPIGGPIHVTLRISGVNPLPASGPELEWDDADAQCPVA